MFHKKTLSRAVFSVVTAGVVAGQSSLAMAQLEEVIVTATKRTESTQDIAVAVSAITEDSLDDFGIANFANYLTQLPGVTAGGAGPGQNTIYIRGVASTTPNLTTAGVAGLVPNVAMYLDEQPMSQPGRNLDVYVADINRVEVLAGPQGTLFGASSQAGTVRLITNKPNMDGVSGNVKAGVSYTKDGEMSNNVNATLNVPVGDSFAIRGTVYVDNMGGYIDNVYGTRSTEQSARFRPAGTVRSNGVPVADFRGGFQAGADLSNV
ncbi:MAG: TonB-dependent receptor plug domain-containing protein, partial [Halieaceae bacterium]|nr:TonB-dependent receptor plug domain-containing protein [Halieaceae bacterium]